MPEIVNITFLTNAFLEISWREERRFKSDSRGVGGDPGEDDNLRNLKRG